MGLFPMVGAVGGGVIKEVFVGGCRGTSRLNFYNSDGTIDSYAQTNITVNRDDYTIEWHGAAPTIIVTLTNTAKKLTIFDWSYGSSPLYTTTLDANTTTYTKTSDGNLVMIEE